MTAPTVNISPLVAAVDAAVTAVGVPFGDSNKPTDVAPNKPYIVGYFDGGQITDESLRSRDGIRVGGTFHTFGWSPESVRIGRSKLLTAVFGLGGSTVAGWLVHIPVHEAPLDMQRDDATVPGPLYWMVDEVIIRLTSA